MNVDGMLPISRKIGQHPVLDGVLRDRETYTVAIHESTVNGPLTVQAVEAKVAYHCRLRRRIREAVTLEEGRINTGISDGDVLNIEPQDQVSLAGGRNIIGWRQRAFSAGLD